MKGPRSGFRSALRVSSEMVGGRYRLGDRIGRGGAADVHEAFDVRLGREVAVKLFRPDTDPRMEERFSEEAVLLARMQHPGLVTIYDAGRHGGRAYLVMQLIRGETLRARLAAGPLPPERVAELGAALAQALAHVHGAGIVHRDVKPSNVLLNASGAPHLADFGIARLVNATRHTASDVLIGTAAYLAPEQVMGKEVGPPADVYALGLVLLECLKGELEYEGTPLESAVARLHRQPVVPASVPHELACLLRAMTAQDAEARPDAEHCAQALSVLCADTRVPARMCGSAVGGAKELPLEPTAAHPRTGTGHAGKTKHTRRRTAGAVLTALSATLTATLVMAPGSSDTNAERPESGPPSSPSAESPTRTATREAPSTAVPRPTASTLPSDSTTSRSPVSNGSDDGNGTDDRTPPGTALRDAREPKRKAKKIADSGTPTDSDTAADSGTPTDSDTAADSGTPTDSDTAGAAGQARKTKKSEVSKGHEDHG
ncbi:serine/threonine protein kinase [Streptomyces sp. Y2F8-2]|uniref:serine/threonine-protein kinase n=1 Tax=Streptomyces sp. Y2F8-2 TaxID=2759675 RepID=UPI001903C68F|nr:serine/threonine-protein kinase [Streptomyces sp. Y2F8-2]GHK01146.1 serine/threonine protein kinase [Streptomyces sp. Y2F8-2]